MVQEQSGDVRMTAAEVKLLVHDVAKEAVAEHMAQCPIVQRFGVLHDDFYGKPGEKDAHPGVLGEHQAMKVWQVDTQKRIDKHVNRIWATVGSGFAAVLGSVATWVMTHWQTLFGNG